MNFFHFRRLASCTTALLLGLGGGVFFNHLLAQPNRPTTAQSAPPAQAGLGYTVRGHLRPASAGAKIYLADSRNGQLVRLDSAAVGADGAFVLRGRVPEAAVYFLLLTGQPDPLPVPLESPAPLQVAADDAAPQLSRATVSGTAGARVLQRLAAAQARRQAVTAELIRRQDWTPARWEGAAADLGAATKALVRQHPTTLAAAYALTSLVGAPANESFVDSMTTVLAAARPGLRYVRGLLARRRAQAATAVGQLAPELTLQDLTGAPVPLSSLRGQYVLVDFWASWCKPCRAESPNLVKLYAQYHGAGLELYGVSFDESRAAWARAVAADRLPGAQVADLNGMQGVAAQTYAAQAIPLTLLLDPHGRILAKNLRGEELAAALATLFRAIAP